MVPGPEFACFLGNVGKSLKHHESGNSKQNTFWTQVLKLANAMKVLRDPFQGDVEELVNIGAGNCASELKWKP